MKTRELILRKEASMAGLGAVLTLKYDGKEQPITHISRRTSPAD